MRIAHAPAALLSLLLSLSAARAQGPQLPQAPHAPQAAHAVGQPAAASTAPTPMPMPAPGPGEPPAPAPVRIEAESPSRPALVSGYIGDDTGLVATVRLLSQGGPVPHFDFLPYELRRQGSDETIARQNLVLVTDPVLPAPDEPRDFQIRITRVPAAGTYEGEVRFRLPGQPLEAATRVLLHVVAKPRPAISPVAGSERVSLELVRCGGWLDCWLARRLLPESTRLDRWQLLFDNPSMAPVTIEASQSTVRGTTSGFQLTRRVLSAGTPQQIGAMTPISAPGTAAAPAPAVRPAPGASEPAGAPQSKNLLVAIPLFLNRMEIPADSYSGSLMLLIAGQPTRAQVEFSLKMRDGPLWPCVLILIGILLGRLFKYMQGRGGVIASSLDDVDELEYRVRRELSTDDQRLFEQFLERARKSIVRQSDSPEAMREVDLLRQRLRLLTDLADLEQQVRTDALDPEDVEGRAKIEKIAAQTRAALRVGNDKSAAVLLEDVRKQAQEILPVLARPAPVAPASVPAPNTASDAAPGHTIMGLDRTAEAQPAPVSMSVPVPVPVPNDQRTGAPGVPGPPVHRASASRPPPSASSRPDLAQKPRSRVSVNWARVRVRVKNALITLSGASDDVRAQSTRWLVRPLLSLLLLVGLTLVGIQSLYVEKGATFGSTRFADYFGLLLWGLSADVASRNLSNLRGGGSLLPMSTASSSYPPPGASSLPPFASGYGGGGGGGGYGGGGSAMPPAAYPPPPPLPGTPGDEHGAP